MTRKIEVTASVLADGRKHLEIFYADHPVNQFNPQGWTTVRNINGSNDFMPDHGGWTFLNRGDRDLMAAVNAALACEVA